MRSLIAAFMLIVPLFGVNLITYNTYERDGRFDLLLSFDAPYEPQISQSATSGATIVRLAGVQAQPSKKSTSATVVSAFAISDDGGNGSLIEFFSAAPILVEAAASKDKISLRLRATPLAASKEFSLPPQIQTKDSIAADDDGFFSANGRYIIILVLLAILIAAASWLKKQIIQKRLNDQLASSAQTSEPQTKKEQPAFEIIEQNSSRPAGKEFATAAAAAAFSELKAAISGATSQAAKSPNPSNALNIVAPEIIPFSITGDGVEVIFERPLDELNKVALISYEQRRYLVLTGSSNVLLDSFGEDKIKAEDDFSAFFEDNKARLGRYIQSRQSALSSYKDTLQADHSLSD